MNGLIILMYASNLLYLRINVWINLHVYDMGVGRNCFGVGEFLSRPNLHVDLPGCRRQNQNRQKSQCFNIFKISKVRPYPDSFMALHCLFVKNSNDIT